LNTPLTNQEYTITDNTKTYTHPDWTISPSYCPISYDYNIADITTLPNVKAITRSAKIFSISYATSLLPLG